jgi:hypothetical protein
MSLIKPFLLGVALLAGIAAAAQAQTISSGAAPGPSIANLPPEGPRASSLGSIAHEQHVPVTASGNYPGPGPGATTGQMPPHFEKPAGWDQDVAMHPYSSGLGPKPH